MVAGGRFALTAQSRTGELHTGARTLSEPLEDLLLPGLVKTDSVSVVAHVIALETEAAKNPHILAVAKLGEEESEDGWCAHPAVVVSPDPLVVHECIDVRALLVAADVDSNPNRSSWLEVNAVELPVWRCVLVEELTSRTHTFFVREDTAMLHEHFVSPLLARSNFKRCHHNSPVSVLGAY